MDKGSSWGEFPRRQQDELKCERSLLQPIGYFIDVLHIRHHQVIYIPKTHKLPAAEASRGHRDSDSIPEGKSINLKPSGESKLRARSVAMLEVE